MAITVPIGSTQIVGSVNYNSVYSGYLQITANSINVTANTSHITARWIYRKNASDPWGAWNNAGTSFVTLRINGTSERRGVGFDLRSAAIGSTLVLFEKSMTIAHNANGEKTMNLGGLHETGLGGTGWGNQAVADTVVSLPSIPRSSAITSIDSWQSIGSAVTLQISRASTAFTHTAVFALGSFRTQVTGIGEKHVFTVPMAWCAALPNATSGAASVTITTFNGATQIGNPVSKAFELRVPTSVMPTISAFTASRMEGGGVPSSWAIAVQGKTRVALRVNAVGAYGSTIATCIVEGDGYRGNSHVLETDAVRGSGNITYTAAVTDSRGRTARATTSISVQPYAPPQILQSTTSKRCNSAGTLTDFGTYLRLVPQMQVSSCGGKNTATLKVRYQPEGGTWSAWSAALTNGATAIIGDGKISADKSHLVEFSVTDAFTTTLTQHTISTSTSVLDLLYNGQGIAFGKAAEEAKLIDCAWPVRMRSSETYTPYGGGFCHDTLSSTAETGVMILLPVTTSSGQMVSFVVNLYGSYQHYKLLFSGYLYEAVNNWYAPQVTMLAGSTSIRVVMGKAADGKAYVWVSGLSYMGVSVTDITSAYRELDWSRGWTFIRTNSVPNPALDRTISCSGHARLEFKATGALPAQAMTNLCFSKFSYNATGGAVTLINESTVGMRADVKTVTIKTRLSASNQVYIYPELVAWGLPGYPTSYAPYTSYFDTYSFANPAGVSGTFRLPVYAINSGTTITSSTYWNGVDITVTF